MSLIIGLAMMVAAIGGMFWMTVSTSGWRQASKNWAFALFTTAWIVFAAWLISKGVTS